MKVVLVKSPKLVSGILRMIFGIKKDLSGKPERSFDER